MDSAFSGFAITALKDLLQTPDEDSDSDSENKSSSGLSSFGPGDIGSKHKSVTKSNQGSGKIKTVKRDTKDIWDVDEVTTGAEYDDVDDPRQQPEYEITYRQAVTPEDMFLQMGNKNQSTASCEDLIVHIKLPDTLIADVQLDVKETFLDCRSPRFKLGLFLPHPVDAKNAKAEWNPSKQTLTVTLRMNRLYDFVNF